MCVDTLCVDTILGQGVARTGIFMDEMPPRGVSSYQTPSTGRVQFPLAVPLSQAVPFCTRVG